MDSTAAQINPTISTATLSISTPRASCSITSVKCSSTCPYWPAAPHHARTTRRRMMHEVKIIVFGATGMIGQAVLAQCLGDHRIDSVLVVGRTSVGRQDDKLREILRDDFFDFADCADDFAGADACFFCLGVSSVRKSEADYRRVTKDITLAAAQVFGRGRARDGLHLHLRDGN